VEVVLLLESLNCNAESAELAGLDSDRTGQKQDGGLHDRWSDLVSKPNGKILITGGDGLIGSALIWALNEQCRDDIIVTDISRLLATGWSGPRFTLDKAVRDYVGQYLIPGLRLEPASREVSVP
jgi:hypothetical protein